MKELLRRFFGRAQQQAGEVPASKAGPKASIASSPLVPAKLREKLQEHPEHIDRLQEVLNSVAEGDQSAVPRFELAVWALEGRLGSFLSEARDELDAALAQGGQDQVARAEAKVQLMSKIRLKQAWIGDAALWSCFGSKKASHHE